MIIMNKNSNKMMQEGELLEQPEVDKDVDIPQEQAIQKTRYLMDIAETSRIVSKLKKKRQSVLYRKTQSGTNRNCLIEPEESTLSHVTEDNRAQKLDGAFFEGFVDIKDKQKEHVEEAAKGSLKREVQSSYAFHSTTANTIFTPPPKEKALELYKELVYTIMHRLGSKPSGGDSLTDGEVYEYGRQVLNITDTEHKTVYDEVKALKAPECFLNLKVIAGEDLDAKDANGLSDPYCMMCIIRDGDGEKVSDNGNKRKKKILKDFVEESAVKLTKIQPKTLNPEWNQTFKFAVNDLSNQKLRLDMWDKDDNSVVLDSENTITSIKGFKGAGRFLKEIYQSATSGKDSLDDFMGLVEIPLNNIPENGLDAWFKLEGRSNKKTVRGRIHLRLTLSAKDPDKPSSNVSSGSVNEVYRQFLNYFARFDCQNALELQSQEYWDCQLIDRAQSLLLQYNMQHEIRPIEQDVIKWEVFSQLLQDTQIPLDVLTGYLENYRNQSTSDALDCEADNQHFVSSLHSFVQYGLSLLSKYRYIFTTAEAKRCLELGKLLMCLLIIHKLPIYKKEYPEASLHKDIEATLEKSTAEWFTIEDAYHQTMQNDVYDTVQYLVNLTNAVNADLKRAVETYSSMFNIIKIPYLITVFNKVELLIAHLLEEKTKLLQNNFPKNDAAYNNEIAALWFELYLSVRSIYEIKQSLPEEERNEGGVDDWSSWFRKGVVRWLSIASDKAETRIIRALEMDEVRVIDSMVKHSTSAVDVTCCVGQICIFWNNLAWPDPFGAFTFLAQIVGIIGKCAMDYGRMVLDQLKEKGFYDDIGQFDVTDELCIMMNNTAHVLQFLDYIPTACHFDKVLEKMKGHDGSSESDLVKSGNTLENILTCAKEDMLNKLDQIILHVGNRMKESLKDFTLKIITNNKVDVDTACEPLLEYFDSNLVTLNSSLLTQVFQRVVNHIWKTYVICVHEITQRKKLSQLHYSRLLELVDIVRHFFHGDGNGVSEEVLDSKLYKEVKYILDMNKSTTEELIENYYVERCEKQNAVQQNLGVITFKAFFCNLTKKLNINVLNCFDLLPMDNTGNSDPYLTLELAPRHLFPNQKLKRTKIQKQTLYPLFDESFQFDIPPPDCLKKGATLVFTLYDHDRIVDDDIAGEVYYDLQFVPGLSNETVQGGFATLDQVQMSFVICSLEGVPVNIMKSRRPQDQLAVNFLSTQKHRKVKMTDNVQKARQMLNGTKK